MDGAPSSHQRRTGWPVRTELAAVLVAAVVVFAAVGGYFANQVVDAAGATAREQAEFQSRTAATAITDALDLGATAVASSVTGLDLAPIAATPEACALVQSEVGVFPTAQLHLFLPDGRVVCSSLVARGAPKGATYAGTSWLAGTVAGTAPQRPTVFRDPLTGTDAVAVITPLTDAAGRVTGGAVLVLPLDGLAAGLAARFGGPHQMTFTVNTVRGAAVSGAAAGKTGTFEGSALVSGIGWQVTAHFDKARALAPSWAALRRFAVAAAAALLTLFTLLAVINRRVAKPLRRLTRAIAHATHQFASGGVRVEGPRELRELALEFNGLAAARATFESRLASQALHDLLTGLASRPLLLDRLGQALERARDGTVGVFCIDLDRFQLVNNSLGHAAGDETLTYVAERLRGWALPSDTVSRFGGDVFVVVREHVTEPAEDAATLAAVLAPAYLVGGREVTLTTSMGVALGRRGHAAQDLLRDADTAMSQAKESGGACWLLFEQTHRDRADARLGLEQDLRGALSRDELSLVYQPSVELSTGVVLGVEALLRWRHPTRGNVPPLEFIPVAEESGLIEEIGAFVIREACAQAARWQAAGHPLRVSVNVSGRQLIGGRLADEVSAALDTHQLAPDMLCLELTESVLMSDVGRAVEMLDRVKRIGVFLSVDDFGTGHSALAYLQRFPVDELKIDRAFVSDLSSSQDDRALVGAMVAMGAALGMQVIAEGVETKRQAADLLSLGCHVVQGYLYAAPAPAAVVTDLLERGPMAQIHVPFARPGGRQAIGSGQA